MTVEEFGHWVIGLPWYIKALWATVVFGVMVAVYVGRDR